MRWGVSVAIAVLFLIACRAPAPIVPAETAAPEPAEESVVGEEPVPESAVTVESGEPEEAPANESDEGVYERPAEDVPSIPLYTKVFKENVQDYKFTFRSDKWYVKGRNAKVELFRILQNEFHAPFIDTIYFDLERRTAVGVCEGRDNNIKTQCVQRDTLGKKFSMPYVQFKIKLPEDWLVEFQNYYTFVSDTPRLVTDRDTVHLKYSTQTRVVDFFIDPSSGLPIAVIDGDDAEYQYQNLAKNQLKPTERVVPE
jgi:hypothetical protein